ncbi:ABC transporter ATP-binding protein [Actinospica sp. MGRD01-02]|uniref:ABC transporter ATP-binding protein n=1 Tax=Actinospica acidithermotolerans TaxID=2828514 RepID=A0A941IKI8_9ACTN|nr:ABC transporter ATP-binding protein [Actinospica acidithermotolerans]MBR7830639.1 ABC transporter ATP-binding protein [Actinospica acidithermotolerans]
MADPRFGWGALRPAGARALIIERCRLLALFGHAGRWSVAGIVACAVAQVAGTIGTALTTGRLVATTTTAHRPADVVPALLATVGVVIAVQIAILAGRACEVVAARRIDGVIRARVRAIALAPTGIAHLEDPGFRDDVERACDLGLGWRTRSPGNAAVGEVTLLTNTVGGLGAAVVLGLRFPLLALGLTAASLVLRMLVRRQWMWLNGMEDSRASDTRKAQYFAQLAYEAAPAKEVRLFGLADWILDRMHQAYVTARTPAWVARASVLGRQGVTLTVSSLCGAATIWVLGDSGQAAGTVARCVSAAFAVIGLAFMGMEAFDIDYGVVTVRALDRILARDDMTPPAAPRSEAAQQASDTPPHIRFEDVSFTYPGAAHPTIDGLSLEIQPGETLAVVGVNGAGKTTMMKLLAGLYQPTTGRITVDGVDLRALDVEQWRRRMTALFQDFVHYGTSVADNVALSAPEHVDDVAGIDDAIAAAGAADTVAALPDGVRTTLWKGGTGAVDLSGGQWQKLAIARALFAVAHGRRLLVLDEPTAHLDVEAEQEFNARVTAHAANASVVIISHRLSNVRDADRIVVLDDGRITESGDHETLLTNQDGSYARLFRLQAARFTEAAS